VVVTPPERRWLRPPWRAVARLMRRLPSDARSRVALAVPEDAGEAVAVAAARACAGVLDGRPVQLLGHDGNLEPRFVAMPVNRLQELLRWPSAVLRIVEQPPDTYAVGYTTRRAVGAGADEYAVAQPGAPAHTGEYSREYSPAYALDRALDRAPDRALDRALDRAPDRAPERLPEYVQHHVPSYVSEPVVEQPASTRELPVVGMRSYVDQLRRVPEPVWQSGPGRATGPVYDVTSRTGALPAPDPRPTSAPAWDTGGQQGGGEPQPRPALWEPGVVPEWDEVLRRQSRTDLRRPDLEEVRRSVSPYERYGRTTPEAAELVAARPGGRHRADPGVDERPVEDEPDPVRTDRDWRWPERR